MARIRLSLGLPFVYGFLTLGYQLLFVRRIIGLFGPSEIGYALVIVIWLLLTGMGAYLFERLRPGTRLGALSLPAYAVLATLLYRATGLVYSIWGLRTGEIAGFLTLAASAAIMLAPLCLFSGAIFVGVVNHLKQSDDRASLPLAYVVESLGALTSGLAITLVGLRFLSDRWLGFALLVVAVIFEAVHRRDRAGLMRAGRLIIALVSVAVGLACTLIDDRLEFSGLRAVAVKDTPYQHLVLTAYGEQYTLYSNNAKLATFPTPPQAEEIHIALWQRPGIRRVACIGLPLDGSVGELLKYPGLQVDIFELDDKLLEMVEQEVPRQYIQELRSPRVALHFGDPYANVAAAKATYDLIIVSYLNPMDGVTNRYFTSEFFAEVRRHLGREGALMFRVPVGANVASYSLQAYLKTLFRTAHREFPAVRLLPAENLVFLAAADSQSVASSLQGMLRVKSMALIDTRLIDSVYLHYLLDPLNQFALQDIYAGDSAPVNTLKRPVVYYFSSILWAERFTAVEAAILKALRGKLTTGWLYALVTLSLLLMSAGMWRHRAIYLAALPAVAGFIGMALQITLLFVYQARFGNVYSQIGLLSAVYMFGLAAGGYLPMKLNPRGRGAVLALALSVAAAAVAVAGLFAVAGFQATAQWTRESVIALIFLTGALSGFIFSYAAVQYRRMAGDERPGGFYLADLVGAACAGVLVSILTVPLLGIGAMVGPVGAVLLVYSLSGALFVATSRRADSG